MANYDAPKFREFCEAYERGDATSELAERLFPERKPAVRWAVVRSCLVVLMALGVLHKREAKRVISAKTRQDRAGYLAKHRAELAEFRAWKAAQAQPLAAE